MTQIATSLETLIQAMDRASSAAELVRVVAQVAALRDPAAIPTLIQALAFNNPGAAVAATEGLVALGTAAVPALLQQLDDYNYGARAWALRACAAIGDPRTLELLLISAREDFAFSVRRAAAKGLGFIQWEAVPSPEGDQDRILATLADVGRDPEWVVRYGAIVGLERLALNVPRLRSPILDTLGQLLPQETETGVTARIQLAHQRLSASS